jgi:hypothetical protein
MQRKLTDAMLADSFRRLSPFHREIVGMVYRHRKSTAKTPANPKNTVKAGTFFARTRIAGMFAPKQRSVT